MSNILTHSSMSEFKNCRKKYQYRYELELAPVKDKSSLRLGSAVHKALEYYYLGYSTDDCLLAGKDLLADVDTSRWGEYDYLDHEELLSTLEGMIRGYIKYFNDRDCFEEIITEFEFRAPITDPVTGETFKDYEHAGKIDGLFKRNGQWWLREFKTTSQLDKNYFEKVKLDTQVTSYQDMSQLIKQIPIVGIIYTVIKKPSIRRKQTETQFEFTQRLISDYSDDSIDPKTKKPRNSFYFHQEEYLRSSQDLVEWRFERHEIAQDIDFAKKHERFYRNTSYCTQFGGCQYLPLCINGQSAIHAYKIKPAHEELSESTKGPST